MLPTRALHRLLLLPILYALAEVLPRSEHRFDFQNITQLFKHQDMMYSEEANTYMEDVTIKEKDLAMLRMVFKGLDVDGTVLAPLLRGENIREQIPLNLNPEELVETVQESGQLKQTLKRSVVERHYRTLHGGIPNPNPRNGRGPESKNNNGRAREEHGNQTAGYEGCKRDYATFVEPLTDIILYGMHQELCREDPDFCDENGKPNPPYREMEPWASASKFVTLFDLGFAFFAICFFLCSLNNFMDADQDGITSTTRLSVC